jgi:hypothetical protein
MGQDCTMIRSGVVGVAFVSLVFLWGSCTAGRQVRSPLRPGDDASEV